MDQENQAEQERNCRNSAQKEQRRQGISDIEAANAATQSSYIPGMSLILQVGATSADHTVGACVIDSGRVIVRVDQLGRYLPITNGAQL